MNFSSYAIPWGDDTFLWPSLLGTLVSCVTPATSPRNFTNPHHPHIPIEKVSCLCVPCFPNALIEKILEKCREIGACRSGGSGMCQGFSDSCAWFSGRQQERFRPQKNPELIEVNNHLRPEFLGALGLPLAFASVQCWFLFAVFWWVRALLYRDSAVVLKKWTTDSWNPSKFPGNLSFQWKKSMLISILGVVFLSTAGNLNSNCHVSNSSRLPPRAQTAQLLLNVLHDELP